MRGGRPTARAAEAGFTLIEVMVSLGLMALITLAGFTLLQGVLGARERTEGRLARLADEQRAMFLLTDDFEQIAPGRLVLEGETVTFTRQGSAPGPNRLPTTYAFNDGSLERRAGAAVTPQRVLGDVSAVQWRFLSPDGGWRETWPPVGEAQDRWPRAIAVEMTLADRPSGRGGMLRRVVELPVSPSP